jgi:hypothetical protein
MVFDPSGFLYIAFGDGAQYDAVGETHKHTPHLSLPLPIKSEESTCCTYV